MYKNCFVFIGVLTLLISHINYIVLLYRESIVIVTNIWDFGGGYTFWSSLSSSVFYKIYMYVCLYAALEKKTTQSVYTNDYFTKI